MTISARDARSDDYATFGRMSLELRVPDPTPTQSDFDARIRPNTFFLFEDETPIAYAYWLPMATTARVFHVVVDGSLQGRGVGGALMRELSARAIRAGCTRWLLNTRPENEPAIRLYRRFGMRTGARSRSFEIAWRDVDRLPLEEGTQAFLVTAEDDAAVEVALQLSAGKLGALRSFGRVFLALERHGEIVAFAAFDPAFPGAMPFETRRPQLARPLLEAMRPYARAEHATVRIGSTNEELWAIAESAGAKMLLETVRMEGPIA